MIGGGVYVYTERKALLILFSNTCGTPIGNRSLDFEVAAPGFVAVRSPCRISLEKKRGSRQTVPIEAGEVFIRKSHGEQVVKR